MNIKHIILPVIAVLIWAINAVVNKLSVGVIEPAAISFFRWMIAGITLALFCAKPAWQQRRQIQPYLSKLLMLGILGMVMYQCLAYTAAHSTSATNMGIIASLIPLLTVGLGALLLGGAVTIGSVVGSFISLLGLSYLLSHGAPEALLVSGPVIGDGLMLLASFCYALYGVLLKRWAMPLKIEHALLIQIWTVIPILFVYYLSESAPPVSMASVPLVLFAAIPASVIAPFLWMQGVKQLGPSRTATLMNLLPIFTVAIAVLMLGEPLETYHVIGGAITLFGVCLAQTLKQPLRRAKAHRHEHQRKSSRPAD